jgi:hypothetical protein
MAKLTLIFSGLAFSVLVSAVHADQTSTVDNAKARLQSARKVYEAMMEEIKQGAQVQTTQLDPEKLYTWSRRWMNAQLEVSEKKENRIGAVEAHLARMKELEKILKKLYDAGVQPFSSVAAAEFYRLEAEKHLSEIKTK